MADEGAAMAGEAAPLATTDAACAATADRTELGEPSAPPLDETTLTFRHRRSETAFGQAAVTPEETKPRASGPVPGEIEARARVAVAALVAGLFVFWLTYPR